MTDRPAINPPPEDMDAVHLVYGNKVLITGGGGGLDQHQKGIAYFFMAPLSEPYDEERGAIYDKSNLGVMIDFVSIDALDDLIKRLTNLRDTTIAYVEGTDEV